MSASNDTAQTDSPDVTPADPDDSQLKKMSRGRQVSVVGILVIVVICAYVLSIIAYSISGKSSVEKTLPSLPASASGVNVSLDLVAMDTSKNQMTMRIVLIPQGDYLDKQNLSFAKPVRLTVFGQTSGAISRDIKPGDPLGAIEAPIYVTGNVDSYPLDRYYYNDDQGGGPAPFLGLSNLDAAGRVSTPVPMGMDPTIAGIHGWAEDWNFSVDDQNLMVELTIKRAGGVLAFVFVVLALMIVTSLLGLLVAGSVSRRWREVEPTLAGWFAALLFALVPLRNFLPGSPPIGSWIDVLVFFWVELAILIAMAVFITTWLRFGRKPGGK